VLRRRLEEKAKAFNRSKQRKQREDKQREEKARKKHMPTAVLAASSLHFLCSLCLLLLNVFCLSFLDSSLCPR
jgi:hypothetical protein